MAMAGTVIQRLPCHGRTHPRVSLRPDLVLQSERLPRQSLAPRQRMMDIRAWASSKVQKETEEVIAAEPEFADTDDGVGLSTAQVEAFLQILCEDTEIAELELQMGSFQMKVRRSLKGDGSKLETKDSSVAGGVPALASAQLLAALPAAPAVQPLATQSLLSFDEADESVVCITSPKVGIFRRGRYVKGKKIGKAPIVDVGDKVKKGQTVAYVDQLGTFVAVEAPQAGEIASFIKDEGQPVEYGEDVVELAPFFGGHIIGDSKYA